MKTIKRAMSLLALIISLATSAVLSACSADDATTQTAGTATDTTVRTAVMHLTGERPSYKDATTRASSTAWDDGAVIYLRFHLSDGTATVGGRATYSAATSAWTVTYYGNISAGGAYRCEAFHFIDATPVDNYNVTLTAMSCIYADPDATYIIDGGELFVSASLTPKTARMRIKGEAGQKLSVQKIIYNTAFDLTTGDFTTSSDELPVTLDDTGNTPYIYCALTEQNELTLSDAYYCYTKAIDPAMFAAGKSGYLTMPSQEENKGWRVEDYVPDGVVDMGGSVLWARKNIGAANEYGSGTFCSWGDAYGTNTSTDIRYNRYVYDIAGDPEYDIAARLLGERWQIPTLFQWQELLYDCTWTYSYDAKLNAHIFTVTAPNGNTITLPCFNSLSNGTMAGQPSYYGNYWTSTAYGQSESAWAIDLSSTSSDPASYSSSYKYYRYLIRPVFVKNQNNQ